ncbi:MAG: hypothetical protein EOO89_26585, partial [Pedobacter sp.]
NYSHNLGAKFEFKTDPLTRVTITPTISITPTSYISDNAKLSTDGGNQLINKANTGTTRYQDNYTFNLDGTFWKDYKKTGRSLNASLNLSKKDNFEENFNNSSSTFFNTNTTTNIDQLRNTSLKNLGANLSFNYSEPLSKKLSLTAYVQGYYLDNTNALSTYFKDPASQNYDLLIPNLSETVDQQGLKTTTRARLRWAVTKDFSIQPAIVFNTIHLNNRFANFTDFKQDYKFVFPSLNLRYKVFSLDYTPSFEEPSVQYIQPVSNNTDPLFIQNGNANLVPSKSHRLTLSMNKYDVKHNQSYNLYSYGSFKNDGIILSRVISPDGVQTSTPINADGTWQFYASGSFSKDFKNTKRQITLSAGLFGNYAKNLVEVNGLRSASYNLSVTPRFGVRLNLNDKIEINQNYSIGINNTTYEDDFFTDRNVIAHGSETELIVRYPKKFVFETSMRLQINNQQVAGYNNNINIIII